MKIQLPDISQQDTWDNAKRFVARMFSTVASTLTQNLSFQDNFSAQSVSVSFTATNSEIGIDHTLGRVPSGFLVTLPSVAMSVYNGVTGWTEKKIYLKSNAIGKCSILIY